MVKEKKLLVIATRNAHKTGEIRQMLGDRYEVKDVNDFLDLPEIEETGTTFLENARLKAVGISACVDGWVVADDSGLMVGALGGRPGVYSSSFGGVEGDHVRNNARLMEEMGGKEERGARFVCTMVVAAGGEVLASFEGFVSGRIVEEMRGSEGFGYDPLFVPEGESLTFGELGSEIKNRLSHRARALSQVVEWLEQHER